MEALRLSFLLAGPCPACESSLLVLRTLGSWLALGLLGEPLLFVRSCRIGNVSLVNSMASRSLWLSSAFFKHRLQLFYSCFNIADFLFYACLLIFKLLFVIF